MLFWCSLLEQLLSWYYWNEDTQVILGKINKVPLINYEKCNLLLCSFVINKTKKLQDEDIIKLLCLMQFNVLFKPLVCRKEKTTTFATPSTSSALRYDKPRPKRIHISKLRDTQASSSGQIQCCIWRLDRRQGSFRSSKCLLIKKLNLKWTDFYAFSFFFKLFYTKRPFNIQNIFIRFLFSGNEFQSPKSPSSIQLMNWPSVHAKFKKKMLMEIWRKRV